ncbi:MAG: hypothetical protein Q8P37_01080 [Candidatus Spechtbacteria bacterium]|nr:hypothetical protein [Candidatus Spechtbacteria bacterium]
MASKRSVSTKETTARELEEAMQARQGRGSDEPVPGSSIGNRPVSSGTRSEIRPLRQNDGSLDERFGAVALTIARSTLANRAGNDAGEAEINERAKSALAELGLTEVEDPRNSQDFKLLAGYLQKAILDPRNTVDGVRVPLGSLWALANVAGKPNAKENREANRAMSGFMKPRYDSTGLLLKAQGILADAHGGDERFIRISPGGLKWVSDQLRRIAEVPNESAGFGAQRRASSYGELAAKVDDLAVRIFGANSGATVASRPEAADASTESSDA